MKNKENTNEIKINKMIDELSDTKFNGNTGDITIIDTIGIHRFDSRSNNEDIRNYQRETNEDRTDYGKVIEILKKTVIDHSDETVKKLYKVTQINKISNPNYGSSDCLFDLYYDLVFNPMMELFDLN